MPILVRPALATDAQAVSELISQSIAQACTADHHGDPALLARWLANKTPDHVREWLSAPHATLLIAERAGSPVGVAQVSGDELALCYVAPQALRSGVGSALLAAAEARAHAAGVQALWLDSTRTALAFYLRHGYVIDGAPRHWAGLQAQPMRKRLAAG